MLRPCLVPRHSISVPLSPTPPIVRSWGWLLSQAVALMSADRLFPVCMPAWKLALKRSNPSLVRPEPGVSALMPTVCLNIPSPAESHLEEGLRNTEALELNRALECWGGPGGFPSCAPLDGERNALWHLDFLLSLFWIIFRVDSLSPPLLFGLVGTYHVPLPAEYFSAFSSCLDCSVWGGLSVFWQFAVPLYCGGSLLWVGWTSSLSRFPG